jgi:hypothetical protein
MMMMMMHYSYFVKSYLCPPVDAATYIIRPEKSQQIKQVTAELAKQGYLQVRSAVLAAADGSILR